MVNGGNVADTLEEMAIDAGALVTYAQRHKVVLPDQVLMTLAGALYSLPILRADQIQRDAFIQAYSVAVKLVQATVADIQVMQERCAQLKPQIAEALSLLKFAVANARPVDDGTRDGILKAAEGVVAGAPSIAEEQAFYKSYGSLTTATKPVTAETLEASAIRVSTFVDYFRPATAGAAWRELRLGRMLHWFAFAVVLVMTGETLSYLSFGRSMLKGLETANEAQLKRLSESIAAEDALKLHKYIASAKPSTDAAAVAEQMKKELEANKAITLAKAALEGAVMEQQVYPDRLWRWAMSPCNNKLNFPFYLTQCTGLDEPAYIAGKDQAWKNVKALEKVEAAKQVAARASELYLPLLLGLLGAYAYVLRKLTKDIGEFALSSGSAIQHLVRLALGAMAGFASTVLLTDKALAGSALKDLSSLGVAFIAGYGIELIFAFMDRVISAFNSKP